ncbi:MAG TPA: hypothetical protein VFR15_10345 [Chloroflexia bacterium]|nr:hypothetical protein [Chloroflexia bacterium]
MVTSVGRGQIPGSRNKARLVERKSEHVLLVEFVTHSGNTVYNTLEEMTLHPPDRITYRHLKGPLPHIWEEIELKDVGIKQGRRKTLLLYRGEFRTRSLLGYLLGPLYIKPLFDRLATEHLQELKQAAEARGARSIKYRQVGMSNAGMPLALEHADSKAESQPWGRTPGTTGTVLPPETPATGGSSISSEA